MEQILINLVAGALGGAGTGKASPQFDLGKGERGSAIRTFQARPRHGSGARINLRKAIVYCAPPPAEVDSASL